ncbi:MAG: hypothetical protein AABW83_04385 [Nanoarchaeota archaeon]
MEKLNVSLDLEKRLLNIDGNNFELDSGLIDASDKSRSNSEYRNLYLIYNKGDSYSDYSKLTAFIESIGKKDIINLCHILYDRSTGRELPVISINGSMEINISLS